MLRTDRAIIHYKRLVQILRETLRLDPALVAQLPTDLLELLPMRPRLDYEFFILMTPLFPPELVFADPENVLTRKVYHIPQLVSF